MEFHNQYGDMVLKKDEGDERTQDAKRLREYEELYSSLAAQLDEEVSSRLIFEWNERSKSCEGLTTTDIGERKEGDFTKKIGILDLFLSLYIICILSDIVVSYLS